MESITVVFHTGLRLKIVGIHSDVNSESYLELIRNDLSDHLRDIKSLQQPCNSLRSFSKIKNLRISHWSLIDVTKYCLSFCRVYHSTSLGACHISLSNSMSSTFKSRWIARGSCRNSRRARAWFVALKQGIESVILFQKGLRIPALFKLKYL
jgi:hypothetical protein